MLHATKVAQNWTESGIPRRGVTVEVLIAAVCFAVSAAVVAAAASNVALTGRILALLAGWSVFGLAGGIVLDRRPGSATGRLLVVLSLMPAFVMVWAELRFGGLPTRLDIPRAVSELAVLQAAVLVTALTWTFRRPSELLVALASITAAAVGGIISAFAEAGLLGRDLRIAGGRSPSRALSASCGWSPWRCGPILAPPGDGSPG